MTQFFLWMVVGILSPLLVHAETQSQPNCKAASYQGDFRATFINGTAAGLDAADCLTNIRLSLMEKNVDVTGLVTRSDVGWINSRDEAYCVYKVILGARIPSKIARLIQIKKVSPSYSWSYWERKAWEWAAESMTEVQCVSQKN